MIFEFTLDEKELKKALGEIEEAKENGFDHCISVFKLVQIDNHKLPNSEYNCMIVKAHPTDGKLNWGRLSKIHKRNKFVDGELIPIKE